MIEAIMYVGIGFLLAALLAITIMPLVHNRAVRLTLGQVDANLPQSMAEIQAEKDLLRAEFAMSTRRLELALDQVKNKFTNQRVEMGKRSDVLNRLNDELYAEVMTLKRKIARGQNTRQRRRRAMH